MNKKFLIPFARVTAYNDKHEILYDIRTFSNQELFEKERKILDEFPDMKVYEVEISLIDE